jgi:NAD(P)-dependent dehydrogenase (short-subunit alcohol dehydrogenase family)
MLNLRNHRALLSAVGAFLVAGAGSGIAWSQAERTSEPADVLLDAVEHSESTMRDYIEEISGRFDEIEATSDVAEKEELAAALMTDVPDLAEEARAGVLAAKEDANAVSLSDGGELDRARDAYVAHIDTWIAEYDQAILAPAGVVDIEPRVNRTFDQAVAAFGRLDLDADQEGRAEELLAD